jgi:hypothetical protein
VIKGGHRGWVFIGDELNVRRKESSIHTLLILIPLTEDSFLVRKGGNHGLVTIQKSIWDGVR